MKGAFVMTRNKDHEGEPEPEVKVEKVKIDLRITSDLLPHSPPSPDSSSGDPPYNGTLRQRDHRYLLQYAKFLRQLSSRHTRCGTGLSSCTTSTTSSTAATEEDKWSCKPSWRILATDSASATRPSCSNTTYKFTKLYQEIFMNYKLTNTTPRTDALPLDSYIPRVFFVPRETSSNSSGSRDSTTWDQAMRSLPQVAATASTLPPVQEEEDPDLVPDPKTTAMTTRLR